MLLIKLTQFAERDPKIDHKERVEGKGFIISDLSVLLLLLIFEYFQKMKILLASATRNSPTRTSTSSLNIVDLLNTPDNTLNSIYKDVFEAKVIRT